MVICIQPDGNQGINPQTGIVIIKHTLSHKSKGKFQSNGIITTKKWSEHHHATDIKLQSLSQTECSTQQKADTRRVVAVKEKIAMAKAESDILHQNTVCGNV